MSLHMRIPADIPPEQLASIEPIVEDALAILRRAVAEMPVDTSPAVHYEAQP